MRRTSKGKKAPGYEYWSCRPFNKHGGVIGKATKRRTHKAERANGKALAYVWIDDVVRKD